MGKLGTLVPALGNVKVRVVLAPREPLLYKLILPRLN
jgi:hypothetical protein